MLSLLTEHQTTSANIDVFNEKFVGMAMYDYIDMEQFLGLIKVQLDEEQRAIDDISRPLPDNIQMIGFEKR